MTTYLIAGCQNGPSLGSGKIVTATDLSAAYTSGTGSSTWQASEEEVNASGIATSADGTKLALCTPGNNNVINFILTSTDSGATWTRRDIPFPGSRKWTGIASSSNGTILGACSITTDDTAEYIYVSMDSGATWTQQTSAGLSIWTGITVSSDGTKIAACRDGNIVTGVYSGGSWTWTTQSESQLANWKGITSSSDGSIIYACEYNGLAGRIWKSINSGVNWDVISPLLGTWSGVTTNATGSKVAAYLNPGNIYVSTNGGSSFGGPYGGSYSWSSISYSSDGVVLSGSVGTLDPATAYIYVSGDDGVTFTTQTTATQGNWTGVAVSGPIESVCFRGTTLVLMADGSLKAIKDIKRGEEVVTDKKTGETKKAARVLRYMATGKATRIPEDLIGNKRPIVCSFNHPFWLNDTSRIIAGDIDGVEEIEICELLYNIQFEEEGAYYAEGVKVDAVSPDLGKHKLPKEMYFDETKYDASRIVYSEDDECRNKPKMVKHM